MLAETTLTFDDAVSKALASEIADRQTRSIHSPAENTSGTFSIKKQNSQINNSKENITCFGCGGSHNRDVCKFRNAVCRLSGEKGHIQRVGHSKFKQSSEQKLSHLPLKEKGKTTHLIESIVVENNVSVQLKCLTINNINTVNLKVTVQ